MKKELLKRGNEFDVAEGQYIKPASFPVTPAIEQKKKRKIAIVGTAPQWQLAPFDDPEWEIWGILGVVGCGKRLTRIYELHDKEIIVPMADKHHSGKYWEIVNSIGENYITKDHYEQAPNAQRFDFKSKLDKYGPYFASSASWLLADAIDCEPEAIAMYGINMASESEYAHQKPSCTYLLGYAKAKGIKIIIPSSSELLMVSHQYGYEKPPRVLELYNQKKAEFEAQLVAHKNNYDTSRMGVYAAEQCLGLLKWFEQNGK